MDRLIIKNFGPLKDIDIELNRINLFIGENGSGKSVLAKLITILKKFQNLKESEILIKLNNFNINFITEKTYIYYTNNSLISLELKNKKFSFSKKISSFNCSISDIKKLEKIVNDIENMTLEEFQNKLLLSNLEKYYPFKIISLPDKIKKLPLSILLDNKEFKENLNFLKSTQQLLNKTINSIYIPSERNLISIFNQSIYSFLTADIPIPKFLISFFSEFEKARNIIKELELLNVKYIYTDKIEIYHSNNDYLELERSSSGIQSALPLYITVKYFAKNYQNIIIEEPEQNLFPKAQKETVEFIIEQLGKDNSLFMMTHSPYILTALNNLILANDVKNKKGVEAIKGIVKEEQCVAFEDVSAYSLEDGKAINIMDREDRLIGINIIDSISDEVNDAFDKLLAKLD